MEIYLSSRLLCFILKASPFFPITSSLEWIKHPRNLILIALLTKRKTFLIYFYESLSLTFVLMKSLLLLDSSLSLSLSLYSFLFVVVKVILSHSNHFFFQVKFSSFSSSFAISVHENIFLLNEFFFHVKI
jgi:hypothetical protein